MFINSSYNLLTYIFKCGWHIKYANFLYYKKLYENSCIYNFTIKGLADKAGKSRNFVRNNVNFYIQEGWCRMHGKNLIFETTNNLKKLYKIHDNNLCIIKWNTLDELKKRLYFKLMEHKNKQVEFQISLKADLVKLTNLKTLKRAIRRYGCLEASKISNGEMPINKDFSISYQKLAYLFHCSTAYACKLVHSFVKEQWLELKNNFTFFEKCPYNIFKGLDLDSCFFWYNGAIFKRESNNYSMLIK